MSFSAFAAAMETVSSFVPFFPCWKINSAKSREKLIAGGTQMEKNNAGGDLYELQ